MDLSEVEIIRLSSVRQELLELTLSLMKDEEVLHNLTPRPAEMIRLNTDNEEIFGFSDLY